MDHDRTPANSPRALFTLGDLVALRSQPDRLLPIIAVIAGGAECRYQVFEDGQKVLYYERQLQRPTTADAEPVWLEAEAFHAHLTSLHLRSPSTAQLFSLRLGRVRFVPYQYRLVLKLIRAERARLLIADEVGVGKTIEAGLIVKELRARTDLTSVLIICPKALVAERKWLLEMRRFDEAFTALDGPLLRHCLHETHLDGAWPSQYEQAILPFSLFSEELLLGDGARGGRGRRSPRGLLALDPPPRFDLVIVDEAHHLHNPQTYLHQGVRYFCDHAEAVLLLTATPVQLGSADLFTLLNLLRPDLVIDQASFGQMAAPNRPINQAIQHCRSAGPGWQREALTAHATRAGIRFGVVHGGIPDEERATLRQRFALPKGDPEALEVLLSSDVGCEGLDFQFCNLLVNYDLPWNPMRIEQRIGRIDRYGQASETVAIVNLITPDTVDAEIYERCLWRIGVFQHAIGGNEEILGAITRELHDIAERFDLAPAQQAQRL